MGRFDFFKKKKQITKPKTVNDNNSEKHDISTTRKVLERETLAISNSEKKFYQQDEYYTTKIFEDTPFEQDIVSFEERKKNSIPSKNGLYVSEILLLHYCSKSAYPNPRNGYPGFWWFKFGIRDVNAALKSLVERNFILLGPAKNALKGLTVDQLTELLKSNELSITGKKAELISRISDNISEDNLISLGVERKYTLTPIGQQELAENEYIPYMHRHSKNTTFTIWDLNRMLGSGDKSNFKEIINQKHAEIEDGFKKSNDKFFEELKNYDPVGYQKLRDQDEQIKAVQEADLKYSLDKDLDWVIQFWEEIWRQEGPKFEGSKWMFRLPDFYIKAKRYDDAISLCNRIIKTRESYYYDKANSYIAKINEKRAKEKVKKKQ